MDLEIEIENNLRVKINQKNGTSSIIESPKATGNIIVPCFATYNNKQFKIISVEGFAFSRCNIESLIFPEDSKVETLKNKCFYKAHIKKIKFPPSLKKLDEDWAGSLYDLVEIEISPKNPFFIYYDNKYLLGKSAESSGKFDVLYYARFDIDEALMPPQVTIIKPHSFDGHEMLKCATFPNNSQIKRIESFAFSGSSIKKLELPASLEMIGDSCFNSVSELTEIKVSPKNKVFKVFDEKCLLMMSQPGSGVFDVLIFGMRDIESVRIPPYIKIISDFAFYKCEKLKSITFESGSLLEKIAGYGFRSIRGQEKMIIPPFVKEIGTHSFSYIKDVKIIEFLSKSIKIGNSSFFFCKNLTFISFPNADQITFEYGSMPSAQENMKIFVRREAQLDGSGLKDCMNKITYIEEKVKTSNETPNDTDNDESKDSVDDAQEKAADDESKDSVDDAQEKAADDESKDSVDDAQEKAADDESKDSVDDAQEKAADDESKDSVDDAQEKAADDESKDSVDDAQEKAADDESKDSVDDAQEKAADDESKNSVDDAQEKAADDESKDSVDDAQEKAADDESKDSVDDAQEKAADDESKDSVDDAQEKAADDESKDSVDDAQEKAADDESKDSVDDAQEKAADESKEENHKSLNTLKASDNNEVDQCINNENENNNLKKFVGYLISHLSKYETVISYDEFVNKTAKGTNKEELNYEHHSFVGADDEEFHRVVGKIGEGATSEVYKVIDERTGEVICKKVVKDCGDENAFKTLKNSLKELEVGMNVHHPCICEALGYNTNEALPGTAQEDQEEKTTIALFFELLPFSIESVIKKGLMSNTLKVRIAVEVAFGMSYLHSHGMMHRDLKLGNIMMNGVFNSKIIDFGLVHISDLSMSGNSMTKGIGTLAYMSPEMVNEEDYDNKTDVYSYGVVLFKLFAERLPKQSMRDRLNNVPMEYPTESGKISKYCINLIKRCTMFEPEQRPTFDEIIEDMLSNNFALASEVDVKVISQRFKELNNFRELNNERNNS